MSTATYDQIRIRAEARSLDIVGAFHGSKDDGLPDGHRTLILLGPCEPGFWRRVSAEIEFRDGLADPLDRWSERTVTELARELQAKAHFPFGAPFAPFPRWAQKSGRCWISPVGLLVHDHAGLMISFRGAVSLPEKIDLPHPPRAETPCETCAQRSCLAACPVGAMTSSHYDAEACKAHIKSHPGVGCMSGGCEIRRACPISQSYGRSPEQSAFHMRAFAGA